MLNNDAQSFLQDGDLVRYTRTLWRETNDWTGLPIDETPVVEGTFGYTVSRIQHSTVGPGYRVQLSYKHNGNVATRASTVHYYRKY